MDGKKGKKKGGPNGRRKASMKNTDAQQYLAETTYHADLTVMYEFNPEHATCAYNQQMEYTPVQVLVKPEIKHLHEHKNVLLQVWDKKGRKIFQEKLLEEVKQWAICFEYFIFKSKDQSNQPGERQFFNIINFDKTNNVTLMEDFMKDESYQYFVYNENKFYAANQDCVKILPLKLTNANGGAFDLKNNVVKRFVDQSMVATIQMYDSLASPKLLNKVHGLSLSNEGDNSSGKKLVHVYIEVPQENKISINEIVVEDKDLPPYDKPIFKYKLIEFREFINERAVKDYGDEIDQYQFIFTENNTHVAVARKKSGCFDIYMNGNWIDDG